MVGALQDMERRECEEKFRAKFCPEKRTSAELCDGKRFDRTLVAWTKLTHAPLDDLLRWILVVSVVYWRKREKKGIFEKDCREHREREISKKNS